MAQPRPPERTERYLAKPCSGIDGGGEYEHIWLILDYQNPRRVYSRGWHDMKTIEKRFGESIWYSQSHSLCPSCRKVE